MASKPNLVVVTGFGPYRNYLINSSWEAVKELSKLGLGENTDIRIMEFPVKYSEVKRKVFKIWTEVQPQGNSLIGKFAHVLDGGFNIRRPNTLYIQCIWDDVCQIHHAIQRYLCEYCYYLSLYYGQGRAVFIHVPPLTRDMTGKRLAEALRLIIQEILRQCLQWEMTNSLDRC